MWGKKGLVYNFFQLVWVTWVDFHKVQQPIENLNFKLKPETNKNLNDLLQKPKINCPPFFLIINCVNIRLVGSVGFIWFLGLLNSLRQD